MTHDGANNQAEGPDWAAPDDMQLWAKYKSLHETYPLAQHLIDTANAIGTQGPSDLGRKPFDTHRDFFVPRDIFELVAELGSGEPRRESLLAQSAVWVREAHAFEVLQDFLPAEKLDDEDTGQKPLNDLVGDLIEDVDDWTSSTPAFCPPGLVSTEGQRYAREVGANLVGQQVTATRETSGIKSRPTVLVASSYHDLLQRFGRLFRAHHRWVLEQAGRVARALLRRTLQKLKDVRARQPVTMVTQPRSWVCVCGSERLAAPVVPRAPQAASLPTITQQGGRKGFMLAA